MQGQAKAKTKGASTSIIHGDGAMHVHVCRPSPSHMTRVRYAYFHPFFVTENLIIDACELDESMDMSNGVKPR